MLEDYIIVHYSSDEKGTNSIVVPFDIKALERIKTGESLRTASFSPPSLEGDWEFRLQIYPNGQHGKSAEFIVYLILTNIDGGTVRTDRMEGDVDGFRIIEKRLLICVTLHECGFYPKAKPSKTDVKQHFFNWENKPKRFTRHSFEKYRMFGNMELRCRINEYKEQPPKTNITNNSVYSGGMVGGNIKSFANCGSGDDKWDADASETIWKNQDSKKTDVAIENPNAGQKRELIVSPEKLAADLLAVVSALTPPQSSNTADGIETKSKIKIDNFKKLKINEVSDSSETAVNGLAVPMQKPSDNYEKKSKKKQKADGKESSSSDDASLSSLVSVPDTQEDPAVDHEYDGEITDDEEIENLRLHPHWIADNPIVNAIRKWFQWICQMLNFSS